MSKKVLCKFFVHGACLKGEHCEFSHDWNDAANNICTFYQKGGCSFGSGCRYEHVRASRIHSPSPALPSNSQQTPVSDSIPTSHSSRTTHSILTSISDVVTISPMVDASSKTSTTAWGQISSNLAITDFDSMESLGLISSDEPICPFAAAGSCPYGERCKHIHGDFCSSCGKHCLHPFRPVEREEHRLICEKKQMYVEALRHSQDIECSVCLERVLSKATPSERKFGLLSECDHPFCIACIRNWRGSSPSSGMDINTALRACPICRKLSYFVIPSVIWYSSQAEKIEIVESYKGKLRSIDCKYFDHGNGTCPFGTSCFYKHAFPDGTLEQTVLRYLGSADGDTIIAKDIRLSDFLGRLHIR